MAGIFWWQFVTFYKIDYFAWRVGSFDDVILGSADDNSFVWDTNYVFLPLWPLSHNGGLVTPLSWMVANLCEKNPGCLGYIGNYTTQWGL